MSKDKRSSLFEGLSDFQPQPARERPDPVASEAAAKASGFVNRDPAPSASVRRRRKRSGRTDQLSIRLRPEEIDRFYDLCDANGWTLGEGFEQALLLLEKKRK
jgi:hypothetical protein